MNLPGAHPGVIVRLAADDVQEECNWHTDKDAHFLQVRVREFRSPSPTCHSPLAAGSRLADSLL